MLLRLAVENFKSENKYFLNHKLSAFSYISLSLLSWKRDIPISGGEKRKNRIKIWYSYPTVDTQSKSKLLHMRGQLTFPPNPFNRAYDNSGWSRPIERG